MRIFQSTLSPSNYFFLILTRAACKTTGVYSKNVGTKESRDWANLDAVRFFTFCLRKRKTTAKPTISQFWWTRQSWNSNVCSFCLWIWLTEKLFSSQAKQLKKERREYNWRLQSYIFPFKDAFEYKWEFLFAFQDRKSMMYVISKGLQLHFLLNTCSIMSCYSAQEKATANRLSSAICNWPWLKTPRGLEKRWILWVLFRIII